MAIFGQEATQPEGDALAAVERLKIEVKRIQSQMDLVMGRTFSGGVIHQAWVAEVGKREETPAPAHLHYDDENFEIAEVIPNPAYAGGQVFVSTSKADDLEDSLTSDEWKEVMQEALKLIGSEGLDSPEGHLEYVRRQLRAAVA
jgi:hypothetical protein